MSNLGQRCSWYEPLKGRGKLLPVYSSTISMPAYLQALEVSHLFIRRLDDGATGHVCRANAAKTSSDARKNPGYGDG